LKEVVTCVELRGAEVVQRLHAVAPEHLFPEIQAATRADWLPAAIGFDLVRSLERGLGPTEMRAIYRDACLSSYRSGPLGPVAASALRLFGPSPHLVARFIPSAFEAVWRGCGKIVLEEARPGLVRLRHSRLPDDAAFEAFMEACAACFESVLVECQRRGLCSVERHSGSDSIGYVLQWEEH
jgi:hypothetical protein